MWQQGIWDLNESPPMKNKKKEETPAEDAAKTEASAPVPDPPKTESVAGWSRFYH